ncbi:methyl-accepting chemotaxis protein [Mesorhizobium sp. L-8-10]|nr:methyl-accepting chemotaxis protein [Mesorhizobium sp. L-8-10]
MPRLGARPIRNAFAFFISFGSHIAVHDSARPSLTSHLEFMGLDAEARGRLKALKPTVAKAIGPALGVFYDKVRSHSETRRFFANDAHMASAKSRQEQHWNIMADAEFGSTYENAVRGIGKAHAKLGIEPGIYVAGYALVTEQLVKAVVAEHWPRRFGLSKGGRDDVADALGLLIKAVMVDIGLAISTYMEELEAERRKVEAERAAAEAHQAVALDAVNAALRSLAGGDLKTRISDELSSAFVPLKSDFNSATASLEKAIASVARSANAIGGGSAEIGQAADDLSRRTEQQAASLEETAAALNQLTAGVKRATAGAGEAASKVVAARVQAEHAGEIVQNAVTAMSEIEKSSREISQIIGVIDEIAFQTNLLALNAGVEAARAGEAGRGFAVVASEVRSLAQRSAEAAKEIKALISASSTQVEAGVQLMAETGKVSEDIIVQVTEINSLVAQIASSSQEQSTGLSEVNIAINQMDQATQQNAAMVEQTTAAVHSLRSQVAELLRTVSGFSIEDGMRAAAPRQAPQTRAAPAPRRTGYAVQGNTALTAGDVDGWEEF